MAVNANVWAGGPAPVQQPMTRLPPTRLLQPGVAPNLQVPLKSPGLPTLPAPAPLPPTMLLKPGVAPNQQVPGLPGSPPGLPPWQPPAPPPPVQQPMAHLPPTALLQPGVAPNLQVPGLATPPAPPQQLMQQPPVMHKPQAGFDTPPLPQPQQAPPQPPQAPPQMPWTNQQSVEQQALNGGGVDNKQQISNFMQALNRVGAGANNNFMQGANPPPPQAPPPMANLVNPQATQQFPAGPPPPQQSMGHLPGTLAAGGGLPQPGVNMPTPQSSVPGSNSDFAPGEHLPPNYPPQDPQPPPTPLGGQRSGAYVSDETLKDHVTDGTDKLHDFMSAIGAHSYQYKSPELDGRGTFTSPMAQELQKTELGKQAVIETPRGLMVDYGRLGGVNLAAVSVVHREQQRLQQQVDRLRSEMRKGKN